MMKEIRANPVRYEKMDEYDEERGSHSFNIYSLTAPRH